MASNGYIKGPDGRYRSLDGTRSEGMFGDNAIYDQFGNKVGEVKRSILGDVSIEEDSVFFPQSNKADHVSQSTGGGGEYQAELAFKIIGVALIALLVLGVASATYNFLGGAIASVSSVLRQTSRVQIADGPNAETPRPPSLQPSNVADAWDRALADDTWDAYARFRIQNPNGDDAYPSLERMQTSFRAIAPYRRWWMFAGRVENDVMGREAPLDDARLSNTTYRKGQLIIFHVVPTEAGQNPYVATWVETPSPPHFEFLPRSAVRSVSDEASVNALDGVPMYLSNLPVCRTSPETPFQRQINPIVVPASANGLQPGEAVQVTLVLDETGEIAEIVADGTRQMRTPSFASLAHTYVERMPISCRPAVSAFYGPVSWMYPIVFQAID
ncbi:MAG: hypothetical protein K2P70_16160 [Hyphomonadaceae bacterium]|nr:hypothetical protein [Hyphomonadaceae bacterium]